MARGSKARLVTKGKNSRRRGHCPPGWQPHLSLRPRGEWLEARLLLTAAGPYVTGITPTEAVNATFDHVDLTFNEAIDPATISASDVSISGPSGTITASAITELSASSYRLSFPALTIRGDYQFAVGPNIADISGHLMDQNQDGTAGDAAIDVFKTSLTYASADVIFTSATTIGESDTTYDGHDILIDGTTVEINGQHNFNSVQLIDGAVLTHSAYNNLNLNVTQQVAIDSTSRIDVSGEGYQSGGYFQGGSYGGLAGRNGTGNAVYGNYANPDELGSGGSDNFHSATPGGGLVRLTVGTLALDGQVVADGGSSSSYGGSGGGVYVAATTVAGSGGIHADGGSGPFSGGGGGRVAVYAADFTGFDTSAVTAYGGGTNGGAGTVYLRDTNEPSGNLVMDSGPTSGGITPLGLPGQTDVVIPDNVVIRGSLTQVRPEHTGMTFEISQPLTIQSGATLTADGTLITDAALTVDRSAHLLDTGVLTARAPLTVNAATLSGGTINAVSLAVTGGGVLSSGQYAALQVQVTGILSVDSTSRIDVSGQGYQSGGYYSGGSYGGLAGRNGTTNSVYGDYANPDELGSGGSDDYHSATSGGGFVRLAVATLALDGQVMADGGSSSSYGGSGGGVYVAATTITGSGGIHADGGSGPFSGGGGGRVAVYPTFRKSRR